jgi:hypothetical protein
VTRTRLRLGTPFVVLALVTTSPVRADEAQEAAAAEALFREGRSLLAEGKLREACKKFAESKRLDPAPGTMLNLARCYEDLGRTASAWAAYRELMQGASKLGQTARAEFAAQKAAALEPSLATIVIRVAPEHRLEGLAVEYDGTPLGLAAWNSRVPVDPGPHRVTASVPGRRSWSQSIDVPAAASATVDVPLLVPVPTQPSKPLHTVGAVTTFVGAAAVVTGILFRGAAKMENEAADDACIGIRCSPAGMTRRERADGFTTVSTVVSLSGLAITVAGLAMWLFTPTAKPTSDLASLLGGAAF